MQDVYNHTIADFIKGVPGLDYEDYTMILRALVPKDTFAGVQMKPFRVQPYKVIIAMDSLYKKLPNKPDNIIMILATAFGIDTDIVEKSGIVEFFHAFNHVDKEFAALLERETHFLAYDPEPEELNAGIEELAKFGRMAQVDVLAQGDILKYDQIKEISYGRIFEKMLYDKETARIRKEYQRLKAHTPTP